MSRLKEQRSWDNFKTAVHESKLKLERIENMAREGMPDVIGQNRNSTVFWIENKALETWPLRQNTKPLANVFEPGQVPFLRSWRQWGGHAYVLLRVAALHYLLDPICEAGDLRELTQQQLIAGALCGGKFAIVEYLEKL